MTNANETTKTCRCGATHSNQGRFCSPCQAEFFENAKTSSARYVVRANGSFAYGAQAAKLERLALLAIPDKRIRGKAMGGIIENGVRFDPVIGGKDDDGVYRTVYRAVRFVS